MPLDFTGKKRAHLRLGKKGENIASRYLSLKSIKVIQRNYRNSYGEIDIIALDGNTVCFIEVKTRRKKSRSRPYEGYRRVQQKRVIRASKYYLTKIGNPKLPLRYDLIEIVMGTWDILELRYHKNFIL
jgi:putative endonuclease